MISVPRDLLVDILDQMVGDWIQIDQEWGPTKGGLNAAIESGDAEEIRKLREILNSEDAS